MEESMWNIVKKEYKSFKGYLKNKILYYLL